MIHQFVLKSKEDIPIKCDLLTSDKTSSLIIILHGFKSFRTWGFNTYLAEKINKAGFNCLFFDFSRNGIKDEAKMLYDVEIFRKNTIGIELDDFKIVLNHLVKIDELKPIWNGDVFLLGHSMGGAISILSSINHPQIKAISLWGTISKWNRNSKRQIHEWKEKGVMEFKENSTGQVLYLDYSYQAYKDEYGEQINIRENIQKLNLPIQVIHGEQDFTVPPKEGEILHKLSKHEKSELHLIPKTGHTFGIRHPFKETNAGLESSIKKTINFFNQLS
jgi:pimeloyl-ACP methyl ester carboxylesterase